MRCEQFVGLLHGTSVQMLITYVDVHTAPSTVPTNSNDNERHRTNSRDYTITFPKLEEMGSNHEKTNYNMQLRMQSNKVCHAPSVPCLQASA